jgi:hypothetical protein
MKLIELKPKYGSSEGVRTHIMFDCPKCRAHRIAVPIVGDPKWEHSGNDFETTTLSPSVLHEYPPICESHFFVTNGEIIMC